MEWAGRLFNSRPWHRLVPRPGALVTSGGGDPLSDSGVQAARASDGSFAAAFLPDRRTIQVAMSQISGTTVRAWWYDIATGSASSIGTFPSSGTQGFTPPQVGAWVLLLDDASRGFPSPSASFSLTVAKTGNGTVTSSPAGISCGADCSQTYGAGTAVSLTATPATGSFFAGWGGACTGTVGCQVTMSADKSVTATFSTAPSTPTPGDFDRDGRPDLLWQNEASGWLYVWLLVNGQRTGAASPTPDRVADTRWQVRGLADVNADGQTDLLWRHETTGELYAWMMNGTTRVAGTYLNPRSTDTRWLVRGLADFNADGKPDVLWHHQSTGELFLWFMDGVQRVGSSYLSRRGVADTSWQIRGLADFNGDRKSDLLWHNQSTGELYVWLMDGTTQAAGASLTPSRVADTRWRVARAADFNADGKTDILWHNQATGDLYVWYLNGTVTAAQSHLSPSRVIDTNWKVAPR